MSLTKYETFLEVVKTGSMSKAAYNLHQTVPGISYTITKLEEEWGISLFNRNRNKLVITERAPCWPDMSRMCWKPRSIWMKR